AVFLSGSFSAGDPRKKGDIDLWMYASSPAIDPHQTVNQRYTSGNIPTAANQGAGQNYTRFSNPDVDRLVADAGATVDQPRRAKDYADALKILNDNVPIIWRSEEHTSELQSPYDLVCRLLLEKKNSLLATVAVEQARLEE